MEKYNPLVSIITVVYNDEENIEKTMLSVFNQTYNNIEYIIIDGGSTDGTYDIIKKYENKIKYWISEKDNGVYDAMNKGIALAEGEWTIFMNSGDTFYDKKILSDILANYIDKGESILCGNTCYYTRSTGFKRVVEANQKGKGKYMPSCHQSTLTRTSELKAYLFDLRYKVISDFAFYYDLYRRNKNYKILPYIISIYDDNGLSSKNKKNSTREFMIFFKRKYDIRFLFYLVLYLRRVIFD